MTAPLLPSAVLALLSPLQGTVLETGSETVVTATRLEQATLDLPFSTAVIDQARLRERSYRTTPQALRDVPGIMVQETAHGQGSPFIRGFTGFRNIFLIDGIRLNNSTFREGPNQYWNTVDPLMLERLEVVKGPGAVQYGTDGVGGTVQALTRDPFAYGRAGGVAAFLSHRVASAEESHITRAELSAAIGADSGAYLGFSGKTFGDLQGGRDVGTQPNTGYDEYGLDAKWETFLGDDARLVAAYQKVRQNNVPRTHRTIFATDWEGITPGSDRRRDLDQERELAYLQLHAEALEGPVDELHASVSWAGQDEVRDRINSGLTRTKRGFDVDTLGVFAHAVKELDHGRLTFGFDYYRDSVDSFSSDNPTQGPVADDATYDLAGLFVQDQIPLGEATELLLGARFQYARADAESVFDPSTSSAFSLDEDWSKVVGSVRVHHDVGADVRLFAGVSQGFRAPNLSDLTRLDFALANEIEVPAPDLDPEDSISYEVGTKVQREDHSAQVAVFYTDLDDTIVRFPNGDVVSGANAVSKANVGDGFVWGIELEGAWRFHPRWTAFGLATWMDGEAKTFPDATSPLTTEPFDRLMPPTLQLGLRWDEARGRGWGELALQLADDADELTTLNVADNRIPPGGTPGYVVAHLRGGWRFGERVRLDLALENLTDEDYRIHGSGQNMPGLNFIAGLAVEL